MEPRRYCCVTPEKSLELCRSQSIIQWAITSFLSEPRIRWNNVLNKIIYCTWYRRDLNYLLACVLGVSFPVSSRGLHNHSRKHGTAISVSLQQTVGLGWKELNAREDTDIKPPLIFANQLDLFTWLGFGLIWSCFWPHFYWLSELKEKVKQAYIEITMHPNDQFFVTIQRLWNQMLSI